MTRKELNDLEKWAIEPVRALGKAFKIPMTMILDSERRDLEYRQSKGIELTKEEKFHLTEEYRVMRLLEERDAIIESNRRLAIMRQRIEDYQLNELHMSREEIDRLNAEARARREAKEKEEMEQMEKEPLPF